MAQGQGRAYATVTPPEYLVRATQVTTQGGPSYPQMNADNTGTYGRSFFDNDDLQDSGQSGEMYRHGESPMLTTAKNANAIVAKLRSDTRYSQVDNVPGVTVREGGSKVTVYGTTRDDQASSVLGVDIQGDPNSVGQALKFESQNFGERGASQPLDQDRAAAAASLAMQNLSPDRRAALADVIARGGAAALESMAPGAMAGLAERYGVGGRSSGYTVRGINLDEGSMPAAFKQLERRAMDKQLRGRTSRPVAKYHPSQSNYQETDGQVNMTSGYGYMRLPAQHSQTARPKETVFYRAGGYATGFGALQNASASLSTVAKTTTTSSSSTAIQNMSTSQLKIDPRAQAAKWIEKTLAAIAAQVSKWVSAWGGGLDTMFKSPGSFSSTTATQAAQGTDFLTTLLYNLAAAETNKTRKSLYNVVRSGLLTKKQKLNSQIANEAFFGKGQLPGTMVSVLKQIAAAAKAWVTMASRLAAAKKAAAGVVATRDPVTPGGTVIDPGKIPDASPPAASFSEVGVTGGSITSSSSNTAAAAAARAAAERAAAAAKALAAKAAAAKKSGSFTTAKKTTDVVVPGGGTAQQQFPVDRGVGDRVAADGTIVPEIPGMAEGSTTTEKSNIALIVGGLAVVGLGIFLFTRKK